MDIEENIASCRHVLSTKYSLRTKAATYFGLMFDHDPYHHSLVSAHGSRAAPSCVAMMRLQLARVSARSGVGSASSVRISSK